MATERSDPIPAEIDGVIGAQLDGLINEIRQLQPLTDADRPDPEPGLRFEEVESPSGARGATGGAARDALESEIDNALTHQIDEVIGQVAGTAPSTDISDASPTAPFVDQPLSASDAETLIGAMSGGPTAEPVETSDPQSTAPSSSDSAEAPVSGPSPVGEAMPPAIAESPPHTEKPPKVESQPSGTVGADEKVELPDAVKRIDQLLADDGDNVVEGDFETVSDVLAADRGETAAHAMEDRGPTVVDAPVSAPVSDPADAAAANTVADPGVEGPLPDAPDAGRETAPSVLTDLDAALVGGFFADAESVARELDEQAEALQPRQLEAVDVTDGVAARRFQRIGDGFATAALILKHTCRIISAPFGALSTSTQNLVGYIGLVLVFPGFVMVCYGLVRRLFGA